MLLADLMALHASIIAEGEATMAGWRPVITRPDFLASAQNLAHYLAFRRADIRPLQERLSRLGLSSLGRAEAHVRASIEAVLATLSVLAASWPVDRPAASRFTEGAGLLAQRQSEIFGEDPEGPRTRIMVTLPTEAAADAGLASRLIAAGADVARINCAHDDAAAWKKMILHVRNAAAALGRDVKVLIGPRRPQDPHRRGQCRGTRQALPRRPLRAVRGAVRRQ
jgi:pyruvate kinase